MAPYDVTERLSISVRFEYCECIGEASVRGHVSKFFHSVEVLSTKIGSK